MVTWIIPKTHFEIIVLNFHHNIVVLFCVALIVEERVLQEKKNDSRKTRLLRVKMSLLCVVYLTADVSEILNIGKTGQKISVRLFHFV